MELRSDSFRINWIERSRKTEIISVTGFGFQVDNWKTTFLKSYPSDVYNSRLKTSIENRDGTVTAIFTRDIK